MPALNTRLFSSRLRWGWGVLGLFLQLIKTSQKFAPGGRVKRLEWNYISHLLCTLWLVQFSSLSRANHIWCVCELLCNLPMGVFFPNPTTPVRCCSYQHFPFPEVCAAPTGRSVNFPYLETSNGQTNGCPRKAFSEPQQGRLVTPPYLPWGELSPSLHLRTQNLEREVLKEASTALSVPPL